MSIVFEILEGAVHGGFKYRNSAGCVVEDGGRVLWNGSEKVNVGSRIHVFRFSKQLHATVTADGISQAFVLVDNDWNVRFCAGRDIVFEVLLDRIFARVESRRWLSPHSIFGSNGFNF